MSSYERVRKTQLKLKGDANVKVSSNIDQSSVSTCKPPSAKVVSLSGRVVVSGLTVQGLDTKFKEEIELGDTLIILNPQTHVEESRLVTAVLTNRSITIDQPLSSDFVSTVEAKVRKDSETIIQKSDIKRIKKEDDVDDEKILKEAFEEKLENQQTHFSYQERTGMWGYRTVTQLVDEQLTRSDLLDRRAKKVHDKYC